MSFEDAYFAGIVDGEGNIRLQQKYAGNYRAVLRVKMTDRPVIYALRALYGGSISERIVDNRLPIFEWRVQGIHAIFTIEKLRPYLRVKAADADKALSHYSKNMRSRLSKMMKPRVAA